MSAASERVGGAPAGTLRVDWPECRARGLCAELLPERIVLDEWGYPVVLGPVRDDELGLAREAALACPRRALHLVKD
ncbi:ferredoxin [Phycicoccus avicenniae]|uniref:ferredoxin n=1 Tax=Phycicoccus avicenniae TaxID=2828860 RepID=UPI003D28F111